MFLLVIGLFLIIAAILGTLYAYRTAFYSHPQKRAKSTDALNGPQYQAVAENIHRMSSIMERIPYEPVAIRSYDGLHLYGRYYHVSDNAPLEILFHGYRSHPYRDCSGGHALSRKMGFNALVVDQRAHGASDGSTISFGILERKDLFLWVNWANQRFGNQIPIILSGLSMGGATVLMSADQPLPDNVCCIIADSPYSSPLEIIEKVAKDQHLPPKICRPFLLLAARFIGKFSLTETTAAKAVSKTRLPILLIHGEDDHFVPCEMSRTIATKGSNHIQLETFPDAGHGLCYMVDPKRYEYVVYHFLNKIPQISKAILPSFRNQLFQEN